MNRQAEAFEKPERNPTHAIKKIWKYLCNYKKMLICAALLSIFGNLFALLGPMLSGKAIDAIKPGKGAVKFETIFIYAAVMIAFYLMSALLSYILAILMIKLSRNVVYRMRNDVFDKLTHLPLNFFDTHQAGDMISIVSYDIDTVNASLSNDLVQMFASVITVAGSFIMMILISPKLMFIFALTIPLAMLLTSYRSKKVRLLYRKRSQSIGELNGFVEEIIEGHKTTKAYGREKIFIDKFDKKNVDACYSNYKADSFSSSTGPTVNAINNFSLALISIFGALMYMGGGITLGNISSFVLYSRKFSGPINEFANIISELQSALAAAERVFRLLDTPDEIPDLPDAVVLENVKGEVDIKNITFGYTPAKAVIHNFSLHADPGKVIAIVGPTGSGKTTVINLLMRFYDVYSGCISIDGHNIMDITRESLRRSFTMVLQDTWLFHGTIYENISYTNQNVTREQVEEASKAAKIHNYIMSLPEGYQTILSDNGINISKGQKQLLTIARAMLSDSAMLILDEATSNVDTRTERQIQAAMLELMKGRTSFVIAHRLSTIQNADLILVVKDGEVVESGNHTDLLSHGGLYSTLYNSQFEMN